MHADSTLACVAEIDFHYASAQMAAMIASSHQS